MNDTVRPTLYETKGGAVRVRIHRRGRMRSGVAFWSGFVVGGALNRMQGAWDDEGRSMDGKSDLDLTVPAYIESEVVM